MSFRARLLLPLVLAAAAFASAGCGNKEAVVHLAETEGIYLDVGELDYQVQLSRVLNPGVVPDSAYLTGLPESVSEPGDDETWFAVFVRVQNSTKEPQRSAADFSIVDTQENRYAPIQLSSAANPLAYESETIPPGTTVPSDDSVTADSPTQGAMLLFKLPYSTLQNRPLEFKIRSAQLDEAVVDLDI